MTGVQTCALPIYNLKLFVVRYEPTDAERKDVEDKVIEFLTTVDNLYNNLVNRK